MRTRTELQAADMRLLMATARREAEARGFAVTLAMVDAAGELLALERLDGAPEDDLPVCGAAQDARAALAG